MTLGWSEQGLEMVVTIMNNKLKAVGRAGITSQEFQEKLTDSGYPVRWKVDYRVDISVRL